MGFWFNEHTEESNMTLREVREKLETPGVGTQFVNKISYRFLV